MKSQKVKRGSRKKTQKQSRSRSKSNQVKKVIVKKVMTDKEIEDKEGEYFDESHYNKHFGVVREDCDCYYIDDNGKEVLLLKFRKNVLPKKQCKDGMVNLKKAAMKHHDNRGASAGKIDLSKMPNYANDPKLFVKPSKFRISGYISKDTGKLVNNSLGNLSRSNIIGYFDRRDRNLGKGAPPCRTTSFTQKEVEKWTNVIPLIKSIDRQFKKLIPNRHKIQHKRAHETAFVIDDTAFSTVTINYNWRTALHKDAGDLREGYGNLVVLEEGDYEGGSTGFPQFGICVDVREGDFLAMDVHEWHCNTKIKPISKDYTRLSLVAYLREKMVNCKGMSLS